MNLPAPGDAHWRVQHDAIADAFRDHCVRDLGIAVRREVDDLFQQAVPLGNTVPRDELKDLVPDAELSLPAFNVVTGSYDPRSLKSTLLEFKTMRYGVKYTSVPRATAVDRFERSLLGDIQRGLAARDAAWHNTEPGQKGPLRDILDMSEYTGMVFGTVDQAFQEDTTTASMETDSPEKQQDAGVGTFMAALRGGRVHQPAIRTVAIAKKIAGTQLPAATRRHIRVMQRPSHLLLTGLPAGTDDAPHVALLFGDLVAQHQAMDEESRSRTVTNLIRTLSPKIVVQILPADVRVVTRRPPKPAAADTAGPTGTRLPTTTGSVILDPEAARLLQVVCRHAVLALPFGDQSQGRAVIRVTVEHSEDREDQPTTPFPGVLPPALSKQFFRCALTAKAICTGPLANLELPTVEQLAEAITATISQRTNTPPELHHHAQWLTDTMTTAGVETHHYHTEPTLLRVGDNNLCAISLGKEDEEFADTLRLAVALTSPVALLWAIRLRRIVIYLTESEFDPSELLIHPFSQTIREAGELGGNTGHNQIRRAAIGMHKKARKAAPASLALRATGRPIYTLTLQLTAHHHSIIGRTCSTDRTEQWRKTVATTPNRTTSSSDPSSPDRTPATALAATATSGAHADDEEELDLDYEEMDGAMEVDTTQETHQLRNPRRLSIQQERHPSQPTPAIKGKAATTTKPKKKQPRGRSRSDGVTRNRSRSKPRLSGAHGSDNEWETDEEAAHLSSSSHK
eukprot:jgi/Tetstr1/461954/TSEL_007032.t1